MAKARRGLVVLLVPALTMLLFALSAPPARAASAVTASENPVLIAHPHFTTKDITLTWTLERAPLATLTVTENGVAVPVLNVPVTAPPGSGTATLTVGYGKTYTAQLRNALNQPLGAPLTITTDKPKIESPGCGQRCIKSVEVAPHGGWAQFTVTTSRTAVITLEASTTPPKPDGTWSDANAVSAHNGTVLPTKHWAPPLANLKANTTYHYVVRSHVQGDQQVKIGSFKTLKRRVDVTFDKIEMIDDSDGAFDGDCDCWIFFGVGDAPPIAYGGGGSYTISIGSGTTVHPDATASVTNAPAEIWLRVMANDDDDDLHEFCAVSQGPPPAGNHEAWEASGSGECTDWAGDQILVALSRQGPPYAPGDVDEQFTEPFTISVNGELVYKVRGTVKVTYGP